MAKIWFCILLFAVSSIGFTEEAIHSYRPNEGFVPSEQTAKTIAESVLIQIYGKENIEKQKPFKVMLKDKTWIIEGSTPADRGGRIYLGGVFTIHISKLTGEIFFLTHSK